MRIHEAAKAVGCTQRAIKLYEEKGLLPPISRSENGYRDYSEEDIRILHEIQAYRKLGISLSDMVTDPKVYTAIAWVMTLGILPSIVLTPILMKKIQSGLVKIKNKDQKWGDIFMTSLFLGMISAFLGMVFGDIRSGLQGWIPIFVLLASAVIMGICGLLIKKCKMEWLETYAMAICMLGAMIFACIITPVIL